MMNYSNALREQEIIKNRHDSYFDDLWEVINGRASTPVKDYEKRLADSIMNESNKQMNTTECKTISAVNYFPSDNFYDKMFTNSFESDVKLLSNFEATTNLCLSGTIENINYSYQTLWPKKDTSQKKVYKNFNIDDFKYRDVAKRNIKAVFQKRKIKNKEECIYIVDNLSPEGVEIFIKKYVNREIKCSILKMLRKLEASDCTFNTQDCVFEKWQKTSE